MRLTGVTIDDFKNNFETGARPYLFFFEPNWPRINGVVDMRNPAGRFLVKATSLPGSTYEEIPTPWQGFDYKTAGKRTYAEWSVTFYVDLKAQVRKNFIAWHDSILSPKANIHAFPSQYFTNQSVTLLDFNFESILAYNLYYAWPRDVGTIALDYGTTGLAQFDVTWSYTYYTSSDSPDVLPK